MRNEETERIEIERVSRVDEESPPPALVSPSPMPNIGVPSIDGGVPTFVFENEPFFGQDRIDLLIWRMQGTGLTRRG